MDPVLGLCAVFLLVIGIGGLSLIIYLLKSSKSRREFGRDKIPGIDPSDPITGNKADIDAAGSLHEFLTEMHNAYGPILSFWMGKEYTVSIASPKLFKEQDTLFDKPPQLFRKYETLFGPKSTQFLNGDLGRRRRLPFEKAYDHNVMGVYYPVFNKVANEVVSAWAKLSPEDEIPLMKDLTEMSMRAMTQATFGDYFQDEKEVDLLHKCHDTLIRATEYNFDGSQPAFDGTQPAPGTNEREEFDKADKDIEAILKKLIKYRREKQQSSDPRIFIDELMDSDVTEEELLSDARINFVGGFHNMTSLLVFALYNLGLNEEVQEKAYREIVDVVGQDDDIDTYAFSQLTYLRQVLDETLRRHIVVPWGARFQQEEDIQLGGYTIKKKTPVIQALGVVLLDKNIWPDPEKFDPDRFSPENARGRPLLANVPFGFAGKRKCPAHRYTLAEGVVTLAVLLRNYKVTTLPNQTVKHVYGLITFPQDEIFVTVERRI